MPTILACAFSHTCPACGRGHIYQGLLRLHNACPACGLSFAAADSGDGPAFFVVLLVGTLVTVGAAIVELSGGWPLWLHACVWTLLTVALSLWGLRICKSALLAWQYKLKPRAAELDARSSPSSPPGADA